MSKKEKNGHRRVDEAGKVSYKRVPTNALMDAIQRGIANSLGSLASEPMSGDGVRPDQKDFEATKIAYFPAGGSFTTFAPNAFRHLREKILGIKPEDFRASLCTDPLEELPNPGASGSIFYRSDDGKYIIKTVERGEAELLRKKLLRGYFEHLHQNPRTLLAKFFGLFCYQTTRGKNIGLLVMNNLLPQTVEIHRKFDLKGSTYRRLASKEERAKAHPTLKDLDFDAEFKDGIVLDSDDYFKIIDVIKQDCAFLESFEIMDYSLLIGIHRGDLAREQGGFIDEENEQQQRQLAVQEQSTELQQSGDDAATEKKIDTAKTFQMEFSAASSHDSPRPIRAVDNSTGEPLLIFLGIIDILQRFGLYRKLEHTAMSVLHGNTTSVTDPAYYAYRFQRYVGSKVFRPAANEGEET